MSLRIPATTDRVKLPEKKTKQLIPDTLKPVQSSQTKKAVGVVHHVCLAYRKTSKFLLT